MGFAALIASAGYLLHLDLHHRRQFGQMRLGMSAEAVDDTFGHPPDCSFTVDAFEVRYYLSPGFPSRQTTCRGGARREARWGELPSNSYCAAFVVIDHTGRVAAYELIGEGGYAEDPRSGIPEPHRAPGL